MKWHTFCKSICFVAVDTDQPTHTSTCLWWQFTNNGKVLLFAHHDEVLISMSSSFLLLMYSFLLFLLVICFILPQSTVNCIERGALFMFTFLGVLFSIFAQSISCLWWISLHTTGFLCFHLDWPNAKNNVKQQESMIGKWKWFCIWHHFSYKN